MQIEEIRWEHYPLVAECPAARKFLVRKVQYGCRPKTIDAYGRNLDAYLATFVGADPGHMVDADTGAFLAYLNHLKTTAPRHRTRPAEPDDDATNIVYMSGHKRSDASIAQAVTTIRQFYDFLITERLRVNALNPVRAGQRGTGGAGDARGKRGAFTPRRYLPWTPDDGAWAEIVTHVLTRESVRNKAMFVLCYDAALRREEVVSLERGDIDFRQALVRVRAEVAKNGRERRVPFSGFTDLLLRQYLPARTLLLGALARDDGDGGPLFVSESTACPGRGLSVTSFNLIIRGIREATGYPRLTPHVLRHQRCTIWKRSGLSLDDIALLAGHVSTETTKIYVHLAPHDVAITARDKTRWFDGHMERLIREAGHEA